ncbi:MAG: ubiquinol-cytochrome c reductase iron-sulfur subunit [Candidatus Aminicenantes bacterium]|nr:MAG: ubiquinol-cytochrome c reductase iron-sulfur subunit [Candidatus Aminicenantes bacterium]
MKTSKKEKIAASQLSRRDFLSKVLLGLGMIGLAEFSGIVVSFLWPRKPHTTGEDTESLIEAGAVEDFSLQSVTPFRIGHFYLSRLEDGSFLALSAKCTHLGCAVTWIPDENKFICPCHSSAFDIAGSVTSAPAPRALDLHPVIIEKGIIKVDTSRRIRYKSLSRMKETI